MLNHQTSNIEKYWCQTTVLNQIWTHKCQMSVFHDSKQVTRWWGSENYNETLNLTERLLSYSDGLKQLLRHYIIVEFFWNFFFSQMSFCITLHILPFFLTFLLRINLNLFNSTLLLFFYSDWFKCKSISVNRLKTFWYLCLIFSLNYYIFCPMKLLPGLMSDVKYIRKSNDLSTWRFPRSSNLLMKSVLC